MLSRITWKFWSLNSKRTSLQTSICSTLKSISIELEECSSATHLQLEFRAFSEATECETRLSFLLMTESELPWKFRECFVVGFKERSTESSLCSSSKKLAKSNSFIPRNNIEGSKPTECCYELCKNLFPSTGRTSYTREVHWRFRLSGEART